MEPRNKGNTRYGKQIAETIKQEVYHFLKESKRLTSYFNDLKNETRRLELLSSSATKEAEKEGGKKLFKHQQEKHKFINRYEIILDSLILDNPDLYQGIQRIYRNHGVDIPSQHVIDKGEVVEAKKTIIDEMIKQSGIVV
jgi:hypothetical protein